MVQRHETAIQLLIAHEQFSKPVESTVADLDHPAARFPARLPLLGVGFLAPVYDVRDVAVPFDDPQQLGAAITRIGAQVLAAALGGHRALDRDFLEDLLQPLAVMHVRRGHDDRQRDATPVHQQVTLAPIFFPGPSGSAPRILAPSVP